MFVAIIDYGSGNLRSAAKAFERAATGTDARIVVTSDPKELARASHIVLPGVGAFADCMRGLKAVPGMRDALEEEVRGKKKPFLGICVGMQMLFDTGYEHGTHAGLGWIAGEVKKIESRVQNPESGNSKKSLDSGLQTLTTSLKIPHMGWNDLIIKKADHPLMHEIKTGDHAYFVHSYHARCKDAAHVLATVDYGTELVAMVAKGNIMGTQFHPEKSQQTGLCLIGNFLKLGAEGKNRV